MGRHQMSAGLLPQIFLIRHGETEWSLAGRHTSRTDIALTLRGEERARRLGDRLRTIEFTHVYASPRLRSRRTGEIAGFAGRMETNPDLSEWNYGEYEGVTSSDIRQQRPDWNLFRHGCPGGESPKEVSDRADRVVASLRAENGIVAVFSHGHFLRVLAARWVGWPAAQGQHLLLATASVSILGFEHKNVEEPVIVQWKLAIRHTSLPARVRFRSSLDRSKTSRARRAGKSLHRGRCRSANESIC